MESEWAKPKRNAKPKPRKVTAWACGKCGKHFMSPRDPNLAMCCLCPGCGGPNSRTGGAYYCEVCALKQSITFNERTASEVAESLAKQRERLATMLDVKKAAPLARRTIAAALRRGAAAADANEEYRRGRRSS